MPEGSNSHDPDQINRFLNQIASIDDEILTLKGKYMQACQGPRSRIKDVIAEVREADINVKAFRALLADHRDERKRQARIEALEADERDAYEVLDAALGDFRDLPLGKAALDRARPRQDGDETLDSLR